MELHALPGQVHIVAGQRQEQDDVPGLLAQPAPARAARSRQREVLFVHLSLTGPSAETASLLQALVQKISEEYFLSSGSVTRALRQVILNANKRLLSLNLAGKGPTREGAITCAVLHQGQLFVVQVGESLALLGHNFGVERIPARQPDHFTPLGRSAGIDFRYYHQHLMAGDMLLLADPRIAHLPSYALAPALVDTELDLGMSELVEIIGDDSGRLLLVEFADEETGALPAVAPPAKKQSRITLPRSENPALAAAGPASPPVREPEVSRTAPSASASLGLDPGELGESVERGARAAVSHSALALSGMSGWVADFMVRLRPAVADDDEGPHWAIPATLAVLIPLVVAIIVTSVYLQRGRVRQVAELRQAMSQSLVLAQEAGTDGVTARQHYNDLLALAAEAEELRPGDPGIAEMRREAVLALDLLDGVTRMMAAPVYTFGNAAELTTVTLNGSFNGGVYVLDASSSTAYILPTDESFTTLLEEEPSTLAYREQAIGTYVVLGLVDLLWRPSGAEVSRDGLAMLDSGGALITSYGDGAETGAAALGLSSEWQSPVAAAQFAERLYVLDPPNAAIWKYFPQGDEFIVDPAERELILDADADLAQAIDLDLYSEDGSLLLVYGDGRIRYYDTRSGRLQWDETDLLQSGLSTPLQDPVAAKLVGRGLNASIFVLDAANGRVVQISRGGTILAQYRAITESGQDAFVGGSDLAIAEAPLRIFVVAGNRLFLATQ